MEHHPADRTLRVGLKDAGDALQFNYTKVLYCYILYVARYVVCSRVLLFRSLWWRWLLLWLRCFLRCAAASQPRPSTWRRFGFTLSRPRIFTDTTAASPSPPRCAVTSPPPAVVVVRYVRYVGARGCCAAAGG